jgi:hypothetical protein
MMPWVDGSPAGSCSRSAPTCSTAAAMDVPVMQGAAPHSQHACCATPTAARLSMCSPMHAAVAYPHSPALTPVPCPAGVPVGDDVPVRR